MKMFLVYQGDSVELPIGEVVIGRDTGCALRFNDPAVSRRHVRFVRRRDEVFVEDLGSTNGTHVNGLLATAPIRVQDADVIVIGTRELIVRVVTAPGDEPPTIDLQALSAKAGAKLARRTTSQITLPPATKTANQRCPRCGAAVSSDDDECAKCHYNWGSFRAQSPTVPTAMSPLARRARDRHPVELNVVYTSSELEVEAKTRDLSLSGVFVCTQVLDQAGTECELTILADGMPPLHVAGIVRRVIAHASLGEPVGFGVEFQRVGDAERAWLELVIAATKTA